MSGPSHDPALYRARDVIAINRALVSVSDKTGLVELAQALADAGVEIVSTGGSAAAIAAAGIPVEHRSIVDSRNRDGRSLRRGRQFPVRRRKGELGRPVEIPGGYEIQRQRLAGCRVGEAGHGGVQPSGVRIENSRHGRRQARQRKALDRVAGIGIAAGQRSQWTRHLRRHRPRLDRPWARD